MSTAAITGLQTAQKQIQIESNNIGNTNTVGFKKFDSYLSALPPTSGVISSSSVNAAKPGNIVQDDSDLSLSIESNNAAMFILKAKEGEQGFSYISSSSFETDPNNGNIDHAKIYDLVGVPYDFNGSGNLPDIQDSNNWTPMKVRDLTMEAKASSKVDLEYVLNANAPSSQGGQSILGPISGPNAALALKDLLIPDTSDFVQGSSFNLQLITKQDNKDEIKSVKCVFGGMAQSRAMSDTTTELSSLPSNYEFNVNGVTITALELGGTTATVRPVTAEINSANVGDGIVVNGVRFVKGTANGVNSDGTEVTLASANNNHFASDINLVINAITNATITFSAGTGIGLPDSVIDKLGRNTNRFTSGITGGNTLTINRVGPISYNVGVIAGTMSIANGGTPITTPGASFDVSRTGGVNNPTFLNNLATKLNTAGIRANVVPDTIAATSSILLSPSNANANLKFDGKIADFLDVDSTEAFITSKNDNSFRFASMKELSDKLKILGLKSISTNNVNQIFVKADQNQSVSTSTKPGDNLLNSLGLVEGSWTSDYNPYNSKKNLAGGGSIPDAIAETNLYDAQGMQHSIKYGFKKISSSEWIIETYLDNKDILTDRGDDGLIQTTRVIFDNEGKNPSYSNIYSPYETKVANIRNPFGDISTANRLGHTIANNDTLVIDGQIFTYNATPGAGQFNNLATLASQINANPNLANTVKAKVIQLDDGNFQLRLDRFTAAAVNISGKVASFLNYGTPADNLPTVLDDVTIDWSNGVKDSILGTSIKSLLQTANNNKGLISADGNKRGNIINTEIDVEGNVIGKFDNNESAKLYKILTATFKNINGIQLSDNNTYLETSASGKAIVGVVGDNGVKAIKSHSLEQSNVDMATSLTNLTISSQRYQGCAKALKTQNSLTEYLLSQM